MNRNPKMIAGLILSALMVTFFPLPVMAAEVDVYIVYSGADKSIAKALKKSLSGDFKLKKYNTKLLAMADYSGKQKAVAKISSARLVVLVKEETYKALGSPDFSASITVTGSTPEDIEMIRNALK